MFGRKRGVWTVKLQAEDGETQTVKVRCHWSPKHSGVQGLVAMAAAAMAWYEGGKVKKWAPLGIAELEEAPSMQMAA